MMSDGRHGKFDLVLVWASDRIARSVKHFLDVLDQLNRLNIEYISFRENIDTGGELVVTARIAIKTRICSHDIGLIKFHLLKQLESAPSTIFFASSADVIGRPRCAVRFPDAALQHRVVAKVRVVRILVPFPHAQNNGARKPIMRPDRGPEGRRDAKVVRG